LQITDVEATCIPWLIEKAKAYVVLRKNMVRGNFVAASMFSALCSIYGLCGRLYAYGRKKSLNPTDSLLEDLNAPLCRS
jgi:hypothetical protein